MAINVLGLILKPSVTEAREKYCHDIDKTEWWDSHTKAYKTCMATIDGIHKHAKSFQGILQIHYAMVIEGSIVHNTKVSSQFWTQPHCIVEVMFLEDGVDQKWYIDPCADLISEMISTKHNKIKPVSIQKQRQWYFYPSENNPAYSKWNKRIRTLFKKFNPVEFFQYKVWAFISDQIYFGRLEKERKKEKNEGNS